MIHFIIINWFNRSGVWIRNWFKLRLNWKIWGGNFNITIIYGMIIKFPHDSWNHRVSSGRRGPGFEVIYRMLAVPFFWWLFCFVTMKCIELIHFSPKTWWEEFWTTDDVHIRFVSNYSTTVTNNILSHAEIWNNWLESCCIIFSERWRAEMMRALTWSGKWCWRYNHL